MATPVYLDDLLQAILAAVLQANQVIRDAHLADIGSQFDADSSGVLRPKTLQMELPSRIQTPGDSNVETYDVPIASLSHIKPLSVNELTLEFDCSVEGLETTGTASIDRVVLELGHRKFGSARVPARLKIQLTGTDPPEGYARINDVLLKKFS